ncbi:ABC transporter permease [Streptomyces acidiscabies]|uniref:ABC transporter permease n=1 Tax=Streptomyces acidiscabies TaxID=42234 RepID=A0AAP6EGL2_9ACTN|nr:ABC transporter permease [Streptomyces acidiscabies]MBP5935052.1 ABC transporter permease [Streptomyces sp. LBUM 1476]MBZ3917161.1 ABC transporter permease [Streptomyces acidiscabies]MDX2961401.1 ABC transporter permease [Streptomyces acidiscabies]MDX3022759.1 ABC transporter permease [Streptomyces acidiscabies]MDX3792123.1 ABC transporter permease [Streptomyces acidiscabies]
MNALRKAPLAVVTFGVAALLAAPSLVLVPMSFTSGALLEFPPPGYDTQWYERYFADVQWQQATLHSLWIALWTVLLSVVLGTATGLALVRGRFRGVGLLNALTLGPAIVPTVITAIALYSVMSRSGLTGTLTGLVLGHTVLAFPLVVVTVSASARTLDPALELAAASLGAGRPATFWHVILPGLAPGITIGAVYAFVTSWDELIVSIFLTSPTYTTLPVQMWSRIRLESDPTVAAVSTLLVALSTLGLLFIMLFRWIDSRRTRT